MKKILKIGHRGAKGHAPENTLTSFQKALLMNADGIELDVHLSADGEIIVIHDDTVDRTTDGKGSVKDMNLRQLKSLRINGSHEIPLLEEVFDLCNKSTLINVEIKAEKSTLPVVKLIGKYVGAKRLGYKNFLISSFDWNCLTAIRQADSHIPLGVLTQTDLQLAIGFSEFVKAETIHPYHHLLTAENVLKMQQKGFKVFPWTVNDPGDIAKMRSMNVDAIITDFPDRI